MAQETEQDQVPETPNEGGSWVRMPDGSMFREADYLASQKPDLKAAKTALKAASKEA